MKQKTGIGRTNAKFNLQKSDQDRVTGALSARVAKQKNCKNKNIFYINQINQIGFFRRVYKIVLEFFRIASSNPAWVSIFLNAGKSGGKI